MTPSTPTANMNDPLVAVVIEVGVGSNRYYEVEVQKMLVMLRVEMAVLVKRTRKTVSTMRESAPPDTVL